MIPQSLIDSLNGICSSYLNVMNDLKKVKSFQTLVSANDKFSLEESELRQIASSSRLRQPFSPLFACTIIGSSGHGKTTILAEMFPKLADRQWLQIDKTDTTSQALVIKYAPPNTALLEEVTVNTWNLEQMTRLIHAAEPECQMRRYSNQLRKRCHNRGR